MTDFCNYMSESLRMSDSLGSIILLLSGFVLNNVCRDKSIYKMI
jgi:hypothetical protein